MKLTFGLPGLPVGNHEVAFKGIDDVSPEVSAYGKRQLRWRFDNGEGVTSRITGTYPAKRPDEDTGNAAHEFACAVAGREIKVGEEVGFDQFVGDLFVATVVSTNGDGKATKLHAVRRKDAAVS